MHRSLLAALNDPDPGAFRRYIEARVIEAMRKEIQRISGDEDERLIHGSSVPPHGVDPLIWSGEIKPRSWPDGAPDG